MAGAIVPVTHVPRRTRDETEMDRSMMKQIQSTASAYFANLSPADRQIADEFGRRMRRDGIRWGISLHQYITEFGRSGISRERMRECFNVVDGNRDDRLEFEQFVTFYYLHKSGRLRVSCGGHGCHHAPFLMGAYFVCVECFNDRYRDRIPFYLCNSCYRNGDHNHHRNHNRTRKHPGNFTDNYMLLQGLMNPQ